jgi:hypothetical protein
MPWLLSRLLVRGQANSRQGYPVALALRGRISQAVADACTPGTSSSVMRGDAAQLPAITVFSSDLITGIPHPGWV